MKISDIIGNRSIAHELKVLVDTDRMPHATLLYGPPGNAKLAHVLWLVQYLMCQNKQAEDSCGVCSSCIKQSKLIHPDLHFLYPSWPSKKEKSKAEDFIVEWRDAVLSNVHIEVSDWISRIGGETKQTNISARNCKDVLDKLGLMAFEGKAKIMVIWMAQYLGSDGNRLLKLIEEPPDDTYLIMIADEADNILNTIRSRCLQLYVPAYADRSVEDYLVKNEGQEKATGRWIAQIADGNLNQAIKMIHVQSAEIPTLWKDWMRFGLKWNNKDYINWVVRFIRLSKLDQRLFFKYGIQFSRQLLRYKIRNENDKIDKVVEVLGSKMQINQIESLINLCSNSLNKIERNGHSGIVMTHAGIEWRKIWANQATVLAQ